MTRIIGAVRPAAAAVALGVLLALVVLAGGRTATADEQTATVWWGPYTVPGGTDAVPGSTNNAAWFNVAMPCTDCYITQIVPDLVYPDGSTANMDTEAMLHHMVAFAQPAADVTCSGYPWDVLGRRIFASGNERTVFTAPAGYGLFNPGGASWNLVIDLMNHMAEPRDMYLKFEFKYRPAGDNLKPLTPVWLDVQNCATSEYDVPAGYTDTHWDWTSTVTGDIVAIGGHVHGHGINVSAQRVEDGDYICSSLAVYQEGSPAMPGPVTAGDEGHPASPATIPWGGMPMSDHVIDGMTGCNPLFRINAGETIRLHSRYNPGSPHTGVMGIMMAWVYETTEPVPDADSDTVRDELDNCPEWPNPGQGTPVWSVPPDDPDCDGFTTANEGQVGTAMDQQCAATETANDEGGPDAWPVDLNDNRFVNTVDVGFYVGRLGATSGGGAPYDIRYDLAFNGIINTIDVGRFVPFLGKGCTPE